MIKDFTPEEKKKLIPVFIITDGNIHKDRINFYNKQIVMHKIFRDTVEGAYKTNISYYCRSQPRCLKTTVSTKISRMIKKEFEGAVRSFKTSPGKSLKYRKFPSISYMFNENSKVQKAAIRIGMSSEGSFSISRRKKGTIKGELRFACANPRLMKDWKKLAEMHGINFKIHYDKDNWSGLHGLRTTNSNSIKNFYNIGGFVDGLKVLNGNFKGLGKNFLLKKFVNFNRSKNYSKLPDETFWSKILRGSGGNIEQFV